MNLCDLFGLLSPAPPSPEELDVLQRLLAQETNRYQTRTQAADELLKAARVTVPEGLEPAEIAARIVVANVILNLDEFLVRG